MTERQERVLRAMFAQRYENGMSEKQKKLFVGLLAAKYGCCVYETVEDGEKVICVENAFPGETYHELYFYLKDGKIHKYHYFI